MESFLVRLRVEAFTFTNKGILSAGEQLQKNITQNISQNFEAEKQRHWQIYKYICLSIIILQSIVRHPERCTDGI